MNRVQELEQLILKHKSLYYRGRPEISDQEYDSLEEELKKLDPQNHVLRIVGTTLESGKKVKHETKMLSLGKTYDIDELMRWKGEEDIISTFKIDGVSCSLIYESGHLKTAKTRGDGSHGEDITNKVIWMESIPKSIQKKEKVEIRGELYCDEKDFFHLSEEMQRRELEKPTNQRNIVAGLISRKDHTDLCYAISFQGFDLIKSKDPEFEIQKHDELKKLGFETPEATIHKNKESLLDLIQEAQEFMSEGEYLIDGLVFTYNRTALHQELGSTAHHPRYKMAFKFAGESKTTTIKEIVWSVSRNGILTPVAIVEPVQLSGAKVSRVTLHNYGVVKQHSLKKSDKIEIIRSGEVIPKFLSVVESGNEEFKIPKKGCDFCEKDIIVDDIRLRCINKFCPDRDQQVILNFIQKIGIDDLSSKRIEEMVKKGLITGIASLYDLSVDDLLKLDKFKEKLANKVINNIQASKNVDLVTFLSALGISGGAYNKCEKVVRAGHNDLDKIRALSVEKLSEIEGFAEKSAEDFYNSIQEKMPLINELESKGFEFQEVEIEETEVLGKKFCITGSLTEKRNVIEQRIRDYGGIVVGSVSKNIDYLVTNETESKSSKFKKANELNIPIVSEKKLKEMMGIL
jgi:DNA ligase (NAD+)